MIEFIEYFADELLEQGVPEPREYEDSEWDDLVPHFEDEQVNDNWSE